MNLIFVPQDFESTLNKEDCVRAAKQANARLQEMLKDAPMVWHGNTGKLLSWHVWPMEKLPFTARLVDIEEIKK